MKKFSLFLLFFFTGIFAYCQISVNSSGYTGIGSAPHSGYKLCVTGKSIFKGENRMIYASTPEPTIFFNPIGPVIEPFLNDYQAIWCGQLGTANHPWVDIYYDNLIDCSDLKLKENIRTVDSSLNRIMLLRPILFDYKLEIAPELSDNPGLEAFIKTGNRFNKVGFIAQEVKDIFPYIVKYDDQTDLFGIDYISLVPYLVDAMQDQQKQIVTLQNLISAQEKELIAIKDYMGFSEDDVKKSSSIESTENKAILFQNSPNPFSENTEIRYFIPDQSGPGSLLIVNLQGTLLKEFAINAKGNGSITLAGASLTPGIYLYSLIIGGEEVDTKRMILTK